MRRLGHTLLLLLMTALAASGCIRQDDISFHGVRDVDVRVQSSPRIRAVLDIENVSRHNITVSDAVCMITDADGNAIGKAMIEETLTLPKRSRIDLSVPVRITIENPLKGFAILADPDGNADYLRVSASATLKAGCLKKKIRIEDIPLAALVDYLSKTNDSGVNTPPTRI